jgi:hypothetical protein
MFGAFCNPAESYTVIYLFKWGALQALIQNIVLFCILIIKDKSENLYKKNNI